MPNSDSSSMEIQVNERLEQLGVKKLVKQRNTLQIHFGSEVLVFKIDKKETGKTLDNLMKAKKSNLTIDMLGDLKLALISDYKKFLTLLPAEAEIFQKFVYRTSSKLL